MSLVGDYNQHQVTQWFTTTDRVSCVGRGDQPASSKDISSAFKAVQTKDKIPIVKISSVLTTGESTEDLENKKSVTIITSFLGGTCSLMKKKKILKQLMPASKISAIGGSQW